jgi:hypothetical protein
VKEKVLRIEDYCLPREDVREGHQGKKMGKTGCTEEIR